MCETFSAIVTSFRKWSRTTSREASQKSSPPSALPYLPCDIFLYMSKFLEFEDYRNLIEAHWPDGGEDELIRRRLWKLSTGTYSTSFFNGKELQVEFSYDAKRPKEDRILLNVETLLPITGPIFSTDTDDQLWMNPSQLSDIVFTRYDMDKCSEYRYANCDCCQQLRNTLEYPETFAKLSGTECPHGHFHHYCIHHISWWLTSYLRTSIQLQQPKPASLKPLPKRSSSTFGNMLLRCMCVPAVAKSTVIVSDTFTPRAAVDENGNLAN